MQWETIFLHTDGRTYITKLIVRLPISSNSPKKKTGFLPKFYVQLLFLPLCDTSPVHFTAVYQIITIIYDEIINVLHTARPLSLPLYYVPVFFTAPSPRRICHLVVLTVDLRDTAFHAHTKHRTTLNLTFGAGIIFLILAHPVYKM